MIIKRWSEWRASLRRAGEWEGAPDPGVRRLKALFAAARTPDNPRADAQLWRRLRAQIRSIDQEEVAASLNGAMASFGFRFAGAAANVTRTTMNPRRVATCLNGRHKYSLPFTPGCRTFGPTYERVAEKHADITFGKVNTEEQQALAASFEIRSIPTLMILRDKVMLYSEAGALPEPALEDLIKQVRGLDMEVVRAKLAAREAAREAGGGTK